jgi:hypothetical protein
MTGAVTSAAGAGGAGGGGLGEISTRVSPLWLKLIRGIESRFEGSLEGCGLMDLDGDPTATKGGDCGGVNVVERFLECLLD